MAWHISIFCNHVRKQTKIARCHIPLRKKLTLQILSGTMFLCDTKRHFTEFTNFTSSCKWWFIRKCYTNSVKPSLNENRRMKHRHIAPIEFGLNFHMHKNFGGNFCKCPMQISSDERKLWEIHTIWVCYERSD